MSTIRRFKKLDRNSLFYDQFQYQCKFHVREASVLRKLDHGEIDRCIEFRNLWTKNRIIPEQITQLHDVCDQLLALKNPFKTMISGAWIYFYTNDLKDIDELAVGIIGQPLWGEITQANVTHSKGEIGLKNPRFKYRTFICDHKPTQQEIDSLKAFVEAAQEDLRASPGMVEFLKHHQRRSWIPDGYFFDHNEMSMATALALINPKLIRKTMNIVQVNS